MEWSRLFDHVKNVQHNELLYTYILRKVVSKLATNAQVTRILKTLKPPKYVVPYEEYKVTVYYTLLLISEYYDPHKGRKSENIELIKRKLLYNILMMEKLYGVLELSKPDV